MREYWSSLPKRMQFPDSPRVIMRFMRYVQKRPDPSGCWLWTGCCDRDGYGRFRWDNKTGTALHAHRCAHAIFNGGVPEGLVVHHTCHTRKCVNPDHLVLATADENNHEAENHRRAQNGGPPLNSDRVPF